jgi:peptide/nickel transport system ATP-binding protein
VIADMRIRTEQRNLVDIKQFEIASGKINLLLGESGIGKTLISRALFGLLPTGELDVQIDGENYSAYRRSPVCQTIRTKGFFVFQEPSSHLNPMRSIGRQLNEGAINNTDADHKILDRLFPSFSENERKTFLAVFPKPYRPSGGEKQRILMAMAFEKISLLKKQSDNKQALFIFDEPTGNLDNAYRNLFLKMLLSAQRDLAFTVLLITHDYSMISELTTQYKQTQEKINYWELRRTEKGLIQSPFKVESYLRWLNGIEAVPLRTGHIVQPLLTLTPEIRVFNRQLSIYSDPADKQLTALTISPGDVVYLKAASGVGKTTVAKIMMGLQPADRFKLQVDGIELNELTPTQTWRKKIWARKMAMVFQHADEALNLDGKVRDIFRGLPLAQRRDRSFLTDRLALVFNSPIDPGFLDQPVTYLSGGQKQRLNLLRALILDTDLLILDEPFNGLDLFTLQKVLALIQERRAAGKSFLLISHNEEIIERLVPAERIYYLTLQHHSL